MNILQILDALGVNRRATSRKLYKYKKDGLLPLRVETWREKGILYVSIYHYKMDGKLVIRCPEIVITIHENKISPISYRDDMIGMKTGATTTTEVKNILSILNDWGKTIMEQKYQ